jgi:hypothetical protein
VETIETLGLGDAEDGIFWIGTHADYGRIVS